MTAPTHLDPNLDPKARAALLLEQMTVREKAFQITSAPPWWIVDPDGRPAAARAETLTAPPGHISNFGTDDPTRTALLVRELQQAATRQTRLGIPLLVHAEALNGLLAGGHMVFPTAIGLAATWSPDLVEEMADLIRRQMHRVGIRQALSPNLDIALDPRWGRVHETYGEDPYLVAAMSAAYIRGLQSADLADGVIATGKHFIGYGRPLAGINLSAYEGGPRLTRDLYAFPFEAAIQTAGLASVMNSYADVDGVPAAASAEVLTALLRETLGFTGFVSSDYMTLEHMVTRQHAARTPGEAAALAIRAGLDTEFPTPYGYGDALVAEIDAGRVDGGYLDTAVLRVLEAKFRLGLFENSYPAEHIDVAAVAREGEELSVELARRSVVVLENDGILPLDTSIARVAVIGPHAESVTYQFATYSYPAFREMTQFMSSGGMGNMVGIDPGMAAWNQTVFSETPVSEYVRETLGASSLTDEIGKRVEVTSAPGSTLTRDLGDEAVRAAVAAAEGSDLVVLALGGASLWFNGERTEGEGSDSADISLPAAQTRLAEAVAATGTPFVAVLVQGRPYALPAVVSQASAVVVTSYNGPFGPAAVADVLFGDVDPSGRLPYSIPRHTGQIPSYHHQRAGSGYRNPLPPDVAELYLDMPADPAYTFGQGLSYSRFELSGLEAPAELDTAGTASIGVTVTNVSNREGVAQPQLYLRARGTGVTRPAQQLAGFARILLQPGGAARVAFRLDAAQLGYTDLSGGFAVEPGELDVWVAFDAADPGLRARIAVVGERRPLTAAERVFFTEVETRHQHADTDAPPSSIFENIT